MSDFHQDLKAVAEQVNSYLKDFLDKQSSDSKLFEAMNYGLFSGGKMISHILSIQHKIFNLEKEYIQLQQLLNVFTVIL